MSSDARREIAVGTAVLALAAGLFAYSSSGIGDHQGAAVLRNEAYNLQAVFGQADGIAVGTEVRMAGMPFGKVAAMHLDEHYRAVLTLRVSGSVPLSVDSAAMILTDGLLGAKFIELEPGGAMDTLAPGDTLDYTQDSVIIEDLLAKIVARAKQQRGLDPSLTVGY
ncbi:MlaD family protein [Roseospira visakhapatnamensis]|uniref:Phospholipid/cholesterol/gamma-HCH transport system substrate-binding protein n=1 Tax=Roseospira visakhapatnamensis TaxID=390880 RepID=A0A7W6W9A4_9PROT|nr:MlaD family protein [Roseospira visakhapatnamensis]MBB4265623.1 phospholipid/cholesterol/gamma-HCH transport system substrate-binding protein [Roseospira visakhapatnamensis]